MSNGAYSFDSELKIYSPKDRKIAFEKVIDKLGVPGSTNVVVNCKNRVELKNLFDRTKIFNYNLRKFDNFDYHFDNQYSQLSVSGLYYKYLIYFHSNNNIIVFCNAQIDLFKTAIKAECMLKFTDVWEATRIIECSLIDMELDSILKSMYYHIITESDFL